MTATPSHQQRIIYLTACVLSAVVLLALFFTGTLTDPLRSIDESLQIETFKGIIATFEGGTKIIILTYQLLILALLVSHIFITILLARPVKHQELFHLSSAVFCSCWGAVFLYYLYGLAAFTALPTALTVTVSMILFSVAYFHLIETFRAYPSVLTEERMIDLGWKLRRKWHREKKTISKATFLGRWRRNNLAWQYRYMRGKPLLDPKAPIFSKKSDRPFRGYHLDMIVWEKSALFSVILAVSLVLLILPGVLYGVGHLDILGIFFLPAFFTGFLGLAAIMDKLMMDFRTGDISIRRQVLWIIIGLLSPMIFYLVLFLGGVLLVLIYPELGIIHYLFNSIPALLPVIAYIFFIICLMISIYFNGAIDPERAIKTTTLYGLIGIIFTVLFAAAEQFVSPLIVNLTGLPGMAGTVIAGTGVALIFAPLRNKIDIKVGTILKTEQE